MEKHVYAVYDTVAGIFMEPVLFENDDLAYASFRRSFRDMFEHGEITLDALKDLRVFGIGTFDTCSGQFETYVREQWITLNPTMMVSVVKEGEEEDGV